MNRNFERALAEVLKHEGGYVDHPRDPGGATNKGITIATYRRYINRNGTKADLRRITDEQVASIYRRHYWDKVRGDDLPDGVDYATFDFAVNSGPVRAVKHLQKVLGVPQDGKIGPVTLAAIARKLPSNTIHALCESRMAFLRRLSTWPTFGNGWSRRVRDVRTLAVLMAADAPQRPVERYQPKPAPTPAPTPERAPAGKSASGTGGFIGWLLGLFGGK